MNEPPKNVAALILRQTGQTFPLDQGLITIGRKSGNTIILGDDLKVSRHHATISREGDDFILNDVGSANGTYLNNQRLTAPQPLSQADLIQIGSATFEVKLPLADTEPSIPLVPAVPTADIETLVGRMPAAEMDTDIAEPEIMSARPTENPYVGPRTFSQEEGDRFFGREREARELLSLIISNRLVLFYAQSGAGKSSLINARLILQLRAANSAVLPIGRVSGALPEGIDRVNNMYVFNLLLSLDESDGDPKRFTAMTLSKFLEKLTSLDGTHYYYDDSIDDSHIALEAEFEETTYVLIIDQFEEILTSYPERWAEREDFFVQLAQAMEDDPFLWVVLSLREDYVAPLDPFLHLMPDNLRARFYMQRMGYEAALEAVRKPAEKYGRPFASGAAESLVNNLRQIRVHSAQAPGQAKTQLGQFVEPVQLQVVCYQLWENIRDRPLGEITEQDLRELADVDTALAQFYEQAIAEAVRETDVTEIDLRNWFETQLITDVGTRGTVYRGKEDTGDIPNQVVDLLTNYFLLRSEARTGGTWYELVHDRFVIPILQANQAWRLEQPLIQLAHDWKQSGRSQTKLLEGHPLKEALRGNWRGLGPLVEEFLTASQAAQRAREEAEYREKEQQRQRELEQAQALNEKQQELLTVQIQAASKLRRRAWLLAGFVIAALLLAIIAFLLFIEADRNAANARAALALAQAQATAAAANADTARMLLDGQKATQTVMAEMDMMAEDAAAAEAEEIDSKVLNLEATITAEAVAAQTAEAIAAATANAQATADYSNLLTSTPAAPPPTLPPPPTPTPNLAATATAETRLVELAQLRAQQEDLETELPPLEPPRATCSPQPEGAFRDIWEEHEERLGCPLQAEPIGGFFAEQSFERGFMLWSQILELFFVFGGDSQGGTWQVFDKAQVDSFNPRRVEMPCNIEPPSGLFQPIRGFGSIWCGREDVRNALGFSTQPEYGVENNLLQEFEHGFIIEDSQDRVVVLFADDDSYIRAR